MRVLTILIAVFGFSQVPAVEPITKIALPEEVSDYRDIEVVGDNIYYAHIAFGGGLYTYHIQPDFSIVPIDTQELYGGIWDPKILDSNGEYLFVSHEGVSAYEILNDGKPREIVHPDTTYSFWSISGILAVYHDFVYALNWRPMIGSTNLVTFDFSVPSAPLPTNAIAVSPYYPMVVHDFGHPYLVFNRPPFVLDISDPADPTGVDQSILDVFRQIVPFGEYLVATKDGTPTRERVLQLSLEGQLSYKDNDNKPSALWFGDLRFEPKAGTQSGYLAGYNSGSGVVHTYRMVADRPEPMAECKIRMQPHSITLTDDWLVLTLDDSLYLYSTKWIMTTVEPEEPVVLPDKLKVCAYPNPFNPSTEISISVPQESLVRMEVFDVRGRLVKTLIDDTLSPGDYQIRWDGHTVHGNSVASGLYFVRLLAGEFKATLKIVRIG
ncbi:MAG: T9SS type A sorting domain-containing protein [Candidatus Marinimicrobia bacterium]|nr:T9SS type A sorting domain-containing protein [Candidatus Neomarinimicrobiota bacterium]MCF7903905.1 T9SS type A sorting domain-containing protein [Candidatus Neomarinimicrobiota bacterium]